MANNPFRISNAKSLAVSAAMPIIAVPMQEEQLFQVRSILEITLNMDLFGIRSGRVIQATKRG